MATADSTQRELVTRLRRLPTAAISDALDRAGIEGALHGLARCPTTSAPWARPSPCATPRETFGYHTLQTSQS